MFASLKSKIKEETGSDISKITSSWRSGAFLGRITLRDDSSISPQMESYLSERTGGRVDQAVLQQQYSAQLEAKLRDRDAYWEQKIEELKLSLASVQGEEAAAAQAVARTAQAEAAKAITERDTAKRLVTELKTQLAAAERAQDRLDALNARAADLADRLALVCAALPPDNPHHHMHDDDKRDVTPTDCAEYDRVCRERAVLTRQLQETKMALADVKTSWSGQIASLETQVARLSRQAGEEGSERRRVEIEKKEMQEKLLNAAAELEKAKQNLANSEAKVVRLNGEVHSLAMEVKSLRNAAAADAVSPSLYTI
ncbi:hypothetical protein B5X24_HaOG210928 [Helicoverpa armigera]|uniref:Uncharacterized protein n=1 Tax=Helicoverpa armigera TaxID=29058 RepID=A0A2W1BIJ5_HELAM|nr:hypothetical protein B5X24_HaOG210928 [Helicoverpa armigera]